MKKWFTRLGLALALFAGTTTAMAQEELVVDGSKSYFDVLEQGNEYILPGTDETWYCQPGFFTNVEGNVWKLNAYTLADVAYSIRLNEDLKYVEVFPLNATGGQGVDDAPAGRFDLNDAIWLNGSSVGFPNYQKNGLNWSGGKDIPVPLIGDKLWQLVLVCGENVPSTEINIKFFVAPNWGGDLTPNFFSMEENDYLHIDDGTWTNGNIMNNKGADIGDLDTLILTLDYANQIDGKGVIKVEKRAWTPADFPKLNGENLTKFGTYYYWTGELKKGDELAFSNLEAIECYWDETYVDEMVATKGADGKLTLNVIDGEYTVAVYPAFNYVKIFPGTFDNPGNYNDNGAIWLLGGEVGQPTYKTNGVNWSPSIHNAIPAAQVGEKIYKLALTVGKEISSGLNFKFYAQPGWSGGFEFRSEDLTMVENDYVVINTPGCEVTFDENGNSVLSHGSDDGNFFNGDKSLSNGDKIILTIDLTNFQLHQFDEITEEVTCHPGTVSVEYFESGAVKPTFAGVEMKGAGDWFYADVEMTQGQTYAIANLEGVTAEDLYTDKCFISYEGNNTYSFNAVSGKYCVLVNATSKYLKVFPGTYAEPATINEGGLWIIGDGFGRPSVNGYSIGWNTGALVDQAVAQVMPDLYRMVITCDVEMWDNWCNWKFFGQPNWGIEFKPGTDYSITTQNEWLQVGESDGNISYVDGASFVKGDVYTIEIDFSAGLDAGVMTVEAGDVSDAIQTVSANQTATGIYNLQGIRLQNAQQHGLYIINGRKVVR